MYKSVLDYFRSIGLKAVKVQAGLDDAHAPARRAYERAGFKINLEEITYYKELL
ncbi:MAG: hypothetical protein L3J71_11915 [Victivallaceae bacterium]|nr:hypothetical protein [Victivallaceae bacterium]